MNFMALEDFQTKEKFSLGGNFAQQEPAESSKPELPFVDMDRDPSPEILWLKKVYPLLNSLDSRGISWEWLNNELIEQAQIEDSAININGYRHTQILVPHAAHMTVETATRLNTFAQAGIHVTFIGDLPSKQPSFFDYQKQDEKLIEVNNPLIRMKIIIIKKANDMACC